jgi:uncharacterized protein
MELPELIEALSAPAAYPHPVDKVVVLQTHISVVFLAGPYVYKIKKPVNLGFLDFSNLARRRHFCAEEIRLNRRLAPHVYLGLVPIVGMTKGALIGGAGEPIEWAVQMKRLPADATAERRLELGQVSIETLQALARKLAHFHAQAEGGERISLFGRFDIVARNARENFEQAIPQIGLSISRGVYERLRTLTEERLLALEPLIEKRAALGKTRDTHGDLHLDHVYLFPDEAPPGDLVIIDCIEFNERFRFADPVADMAFLVMDLIFHGRRDLARPFAAAYFEAAADAEGLALLPFYVAYRAAVRGKVEGMELAEKEIPADERTRALLKSRGHWLLALGELEQPAHRPCLILIGGLPGSGKSTLAALLAERAQCRLLRSDVVRKELAGIASKDRARAHFGEGIYTSEWTDKTYAECLRQAESMIFEGQRVIVDANFGTEAKRELFLAAARRLGVPALFLLCTADPAVVGTRLDQRQGDASDADRSIHQKAAQRWEAPGPAARSALREISTTGAKVQALEQALTVLTEAGLL